MTNLSQERMAEILLIEDNPGDALLTKEALLEARIGNRLHHVGDGEAAMRCLRKEGEFAESPRPDLILLDLNLPGMDGLEVLAEIRADRALQSIPVVNLSTSAAENDISKSYELQANCYICKPVEFVEFAHVVKEIVNFWFTVARLPT